MVVQIYTKYLKKTNNLPLIFKKNIIRKQKMEF